METGIAKIVKARNWFFLFLFWRHYSARTQLRKKNLLIKRRSWKNCAARDMSGMMNTLNGQLLKNIKNLKSENPTVNCTTCHRGQTKPALNYLIETNICA